MSNEPRLIGMRQDVTIPAPNTARAQAYIAMLTCIGMRRADVLRAVNHAETQWNKTRNADVIDRQRPAGWLKRYGIFE